MALVQNSNQESFQNLATEEEEARKNNSDDFSMLEEDNAKQTEVVDSEEVETNRHPTGTVTKLVFQTSPRNAEFVYKVWTAFITLHLFLIPCLIGLSLGLLLSLNDTKEEDTMIDVKHTIICGLLGTAVLIGLPFHIITLADLEDTVNDIRHSSEPQQEESSHDSLFDVSDYSAESSLSLADGDNIEKAVVGVP